MHYDLVIVGGGPAGAIFARALKRQYRVLLIDDKVSDGSLVTPVRGKQKCCGGLLAPDAQKMLARLGLGLPKEMLVSPQIFAVRTIDLNRSISLKRLEEVYYQRFYYNMDRALFDRWLLSLLPDWLDYLDRTRVQKIEALKTGFVLSLRTPTEKRQVTADYLVGADGAMSIVRRTFFGEFDIRRYVAIQEWYPVKNPMPYYTAIFDEQVTDFYAWMIPKDEQVVLGAAIPVGAQVNWRFEQLKERMQSQGLLKGGLPIKKEGCYLLRPTASVCMGNQRIGLIGEAGGFISPSSAEGFSYAFRSADCLAKSMAQGLHGFDERYRRLARGMRFELVLKHLKVPFMYQPLLRRGVMTLGVGQLKKR